MIKKNVPHHSMHTSHPEVQKRLKRAHGHLQKIITMLDESSPCLDIAQQMQAVEKAIKNAKALLIQDHIDHCLQSSIGKKDAAQETVRQFKEITKYL